MRILVVEDTKIHQEAAKEMLAEHDLTITDSCYAALSLIRDNDPFDVVLTDMMIPGG